jgi:hypothetical protein
MATGLQIKVGADTTEFKQEIRQLPKEFQKAEEEIAQSAERVGGALDGALKGLLTAGTVVALERIINHFDKVADAASKYGETAEDIQRVAFAAELTGDSLDSVAMAMERAGVAAAKAARGNQEFVEKFNRAGIDAVAFSAASLTERVDMVASAQLSAGASGEKHAAVLEALGNAIAGIDFKRISDGMDEVVVASDETVKKLSRANDMLVKAKQLALVAGAEGMGVFGDEMERVGAILGGSSGGLISTLGSLNQILVKLTPFAPISKLLGFGGQTEKEMEDAEKRFNAIALLRSRDGTNNATEDQIKAEIQAMKEREKIASRPPPPGSDDDLDNKNTKTEKNAQIKQRLLEISLQLKEAEAANNSELVDHLKHSEDLYKGILKYKDAEDGYGMAVREANAELAKRQQIVSKGSQGGSEFEQVRAKYIEGLSRFTSSLSPEELKARQENSQRYHELTRLNPELLNVGGAASRMANAAAMTEPERQRAEAAGRTSSPGAAADADKIATETTLQKAVEFLKELTGKLPQPVLV